MKFAQVLEQKRTEALAAVCMREIRAAESATTKVAMEKGAGMAQRVGQFWELVKRPFTSDIDRMANIAKQKVFSGLAELVSSVPKDPATLNAWMTQSTIHELEKNVTKVLDTGATSTERSVMQSVEAPEGVRRMQDIMKLTDALTEQKKIPLKAVVGLAGAFGLGATAMAEVERMSTNKAHRDNMVSIMRDTQIPLSLKPRAKEMYEVLVRYAPSIAKDTVFSKDFTKNLIRHEAVDHKVISDLISAEKAYQESKGRRGEFLQAMGGIALKAGGL